jgi:flagellar L-ring protein precursor FlgH
MPTNTVMPRARDAKGKRNFSQNVRVIFVAAALFVPGTVATAQSLWREDTVRPMFADKRATGIGDILTIVVSENTAMTKNNETKTSKQSSWAAAVTSFLFPGFAQFKHTTPAVNYNSTLTHDGSGAVNNSQSIVTHVAVKVIDVLPNQNLVIEGKRDTAFSGEHQTVTLHGVVRPEDVQYGNTIASDNIADASITITGKGTVSDSQNKGWFTRVIDKVNPF